MVEIEVGRDGDMLQLFPGLKATPWMYGNDLFISVDSCHKFIPKVTAYKAVMTLKETWWRANRRNYEQRPKDEIVDAFKEYVLEVYEGQSIVTNYGNKKPYKIADFEAEVDLRGKTFERIADGVKSEISIFDYFKGAYDVELKFPVQSCFICKFGGKKMFIPSEACSFEGIPSDIKKNKFAMKEVFKHCLISPQDRIQRSIDGVQSLIQASELSKWGLEIEAKPHQVTAKVLKQPMLGKSNAPCNEDTLRRLTVEQSADFDGKNWTMAYQSDKYDAANTFLGALFKAQRQLGIQLSEPENWMEFSREGNMKELEQVYQGYLESSKKPDMVLIVLDREHNYSAFKNFFSAKGIPTQVVRVQNAMKGNLSVASNVLKQMNPKMGVDNYSLQIPRGICKKTMLIGVDVTHKPRKSIAGIVATFNDSLMQYNSQYLIQEKG